MKTTTEKDELMRRYLLDEMSDEERQSIEEKFLEDDDFFEEITAFEDELFYEYRQNRLSPPQRRVFEEKFLKTPQDRRRAEFAETFLQATDEIGKEKSAPDFWQSIAAFFSFSNSAWRVGIALAVILIAIGLGFWLLKNPNQPSEIVTISKEVNLKTPTEVRLETPTPIDEKIIEEKKKEQENLDQQLAEEIQKDEQDTDKIKEIEAKREKLKREIEENQKKNLPQKTQSAPKTVVAAFLLPGVFTRNNGEGANKIKLLPEVKTLKLSLSLKNQEEYPNYRVNLSNIDVGEVWSGTTSKTKGKGAKRILLLKIPAGILQRADYELTLSGLTPDGKTEEITVYYFTVSK